MKRVDINIQEETWIRSYWRPMMAWQYFAVCVCDFIIFPLVAMWFAKQTGQPWHWDPMTLKESGFYHIAMGIVIGVSAWTRGQENLLKVKLFGQYALENGDDKEKMYIDEDEGTDPPAPSSSKKGG